MTTVVLWRHGNTDWNNERRYQGQTDVPLNSRGVAQAAAAAPRLAALNPDLIISSDLGRAFQTASALSALTGLPVERDQRLRERNFGPWEGLTRPEVEERFPAEFLRWKQGESLPEDGLEDLAELGKRMTEAIMSAGERTDGLAVLVTHGASVRYGLAALLSWPLDMSRTLKPVDNCHWCELRSVTTYEEGHLWQLGCYNVGV